MDEKSAEITKYAANSFLAMKISFMNDLSSYCEKIGVDITDVRLGIGSDSRIGKKFIYAGVGYGGSCFPKDVRALIHSARKAGTPLRIVEAVEQVNKDQIQRFINRILQRFQGTLAGKNVAVWGLAFKPNTDDVRDTPAYPLVDAMLSAGASVSVYDPEAAANTRNVYGDRVRYASTMYNCVDAADLLVLITEWNEFRKPDFERVRTQMKNAVIFDGRNMYDPETMNDLGFEYYSVGRPTIL
jgi:UDPglucose 6-dehydrogenase